jgi:hypothetical protein
MEQEHAREMQPMLAEQALSEAWGSTKMNPDVQKFVVDNAKQIAEAFKGKLISVEDARKILGAPSAAQVEMAVATLGETAKKVEVSKPTLEGFQPSQEMAQEKISDLQAQVEATRGQRKGIAVPEAGSGEFLSGAAATREAAATIQKKFAGGGAIELPADDVVDIRSQMISTQEQQRVSQDVNTRKAA